MSTRPDTVVFRPVVLPTPAVVTIWLTVWRVLRGLVRLLVRHPLACGLTSGVGVLWWVCGWRVTLVMVAVLGCGLGFWASWWPEKFIVVVGWRLLAWWRWMWVYRRRWGGVMAITGLARSVEGSTFAPDLVKVTCNGWADTVTVQMLRGQTDQDWADVSGGLAHGFGASWCKVTSPMPGRVRLVFPRRDPLGRPLAARPIPDGPLVAHAEIGVGEDGRPYRLKLHGTHVLIAGATGAGKGSWLWGAVRGLLPAVAAGLAEIWGLDPKRMELSYGRALFSRYASSPEDCAELLEAAVEVMQERADRYAGVRRNHEATTADPFVLVIVDEVAFLTAYQPDRGLKQRISASLATLTTQGRAVGVCVLAALQDPRKEVLTIRNLFPDKIALRLDEAEQVDLVLGDGARDRGALCDQIARDPSNPSVGAGIGFVRLEADPTPVRVRAGYVSDDDIRQMVLGYSAMFKGVV
ncbi:FtsK/SpoIIIE domain-containing protein [Rhizohabitans arisaemae]|uniref:FtsK/SpoIIIE domain-containing protein n=1 Tax=Rhizohabitans arisaemae TaxID=2720610 RepID=UPI0024B06A7A|nr:FtsK/SpoIIIE domain-containing protein [Rhizohabitans arisaemae]